MRFEKIRDNTRVYEFANEEEMINTLSDAIANYFGHIKTGMEKSLTYDENFLYLVQKGKEKKFKEALHSWDLCDMHEYNGKFFFRIDLYDRDEELVMDNYVLCVAMERASNKIRRKNKGGNSARKSRQ